MRSEGFVIDPAVGFTVGNAPKGVPVGILEIKELPRIRIRGLR